MPSFSQTPNYRSALRAMDDRDFATAIKRFTTEPWDSPCYVLALGYAASCHVCYEQLEQAEQLFDQFVKEIDTRGCPHSPSHVQFLCKRGEVVRARGRRSEALKLLTEARNLAAELLKLNDEWRNDLLIQKANVTGAIAVTHLDMDRPDLAIIDFRKALNEYRSLPEPFYEGIAAALTNMAYALKKADEPLKAVYSLEEARAVAARTGDLEQVTRTESVLSQLFGKDSAALMQAATEAQDNGQFETAFIRYCSALDLNLGKGNLGKARKSAEAARQLASSLDLSCLHLPKFRKSDALLARREGASDSAVADILSLGAAEWFDRLSNPNLSAEDFDLVSVDLHEHFRTLARDLICLGDLKRALLAFEAGRALSTGRDVDAQFVDRVIRPNPFTKCWSGIDTKLIDEIQSGLDDGEVVIAICEIPPNLTAFILKRENIDHVEVEIGDERDVIRSWFEDMHMVPHRLKAGKGEQAIPQPVIELGKLLSTAIGGSSIKRLIPYKLTHLVPWRAVLRNAKVGWPQLQFSVEFALFVLKKPLDAGQLRSAGAQSLGFGSVTGIDFKDEALAFAEAWGANASIMEPCTAAKVRAAFESNKTTLISCHGVTSDGRLFLKLQAENSGNSEQVDPLECLPEQMSVPLLVLSACLSGVYMMDDGDNPVGFAPVALRRGASRVVCSRWEIGASFAKEMVVGLASQIQRQPTVEAAFVSILSELETSGSDLWQELACVELLGQG